MNEINEEIKLTINTMQCDIDDGAHGELQSHLYSLLEMKRNELQQRLAEQSWAEPDTHDQTPCKSGQIAGGAKPLPAEELMAGGWWCADVSEECANAFKSQGLSVLNPSDWGSDVEYISCGIGEMGSVVRNLYDLRYGKQIHRFGNEFYWSEK